jgi:hypothetical protein
VKWSFSIKFHGFCRFWTSTLEDAVSQKTIGPPIMRESITSSKIPATDAATRRHNEEIGKRKFPALQYTSIGYHNSANSDDCQVPNRLRSAGQYLVKFATEKHRPIPGQVNTRKGSTSPNGVISRTVPSPMYVRARLSTSISAWIRK